MSSDVIVQMGSAPSRRAEAGQVAGTWSDLGRAGGSVTTGLRHARIDPGRRSTPVHAHDAEEEVFYVLAGGGLSWQDGKTCAVGPGDCIVHVAGGAAHTLIAGPEGLEALAFGTRHAPATARLPRAGVAWLGPMWVEIGGEPHPWAREAAAGELECPDPGERFASVVNVDQMPPVARDRGDTHVVRRALARSAGSRLTGLNHVVVESGALSCPPHVHAAEEEIFVVLEGAGTLELYRVRERTSRPPGTASANGRQRRRAACWQRPRARSARRPRGTHRPRLRRTAQRRDDLLPALAQTLVSRARCRRTLAAL